MVKAPRTRVNENSSTLYFVIIIPPERMQNIMPSNYDYASYDYGITFVWQGLKVTRQSMWRCSLSWQAVSANRHPSVGHFMSNQQSLGMRLAQLSRDASAAVSSSYMISKLHPKWNYIVLMFFFAQVTYPLLDFSGCSTSLELTSEECGDWIHWRCRKV